MEDKMKNHLIKALDKNVRTDGRKCLDYRKISIETGVCKNAEGSSRVKFGDAEVIAGVKLEINEPYPDSPDEGSIMVGVELTPLANPEFELGRPGIDSIELARVTDRGIRESGAINLKKLCIKKGELCWMVIIDVIPINADGNLFDMAALAAMAALKDAKLPELVDGKIEYDKLTKNALPLEKEPISITVRKIGNHYLVDPTEDEEAMTESRLTVAVGKDGTIHAMQKGEVKTISKEDVAQFVKIAKEKAKELRKYL